MEKFSTFLLVARQRFEALPSNDRRALLIMVSAIALTVLYFSLSVSREYQQSAIMRYKDSSEDNRWIALNLPKISSMTNPASQSATQDASLINRATTLAKPFGIVFKRFQPEEETGLRLWIEGAEFDQLMRWIAALGQQGIRVDQIDINKQEKQPGIADARVKLSI